MGKFILTNKAVEDLSTIWNYSVDTWSEAQADKYYDLLLELCQAIADSLVSGKHYPEVDEQILGFRTGQHIIFYRPQKENVEIIRILHSRMDLKSRLNE